MDVSSVPTRKKDNPRALQNKHTRSWIKSEKTPEGVFMLNKSYHQLNHTLSLHRISNLHEACNVSTNHIVSGFAVFALAARAVSWMLFIIPQAFRQLPRASSWSPWSFASFPPGCCPPAFDTLPENTSHRCLSEFTWSAVFNDVPPFSKTTSFCEVRCVTEKAQSAFIHSGCDLPSDQPLCGHPYHLRNLWYVPRDYFQVHQKCELFSC